jgi:hypothetical protein
MMGAQVSEPAFSRGGEDQAPEHVGCMCSEYVGGLSIAQVGVDKESEKNHSRRVFIQFGVFMNSNYKRYGALGFPLFSNNYQPIPVKGKQPVVEKWTTLPITKEQVEGWSDLHPNEGVGILTGKGEHPIFAADFDFYDVQTCSILTKAFQERFGNGLVRVGRPPKTLILYAGNGQHQKITSPYWIDVDNPVKPDGKQLLQRFELLGTGQQFVAFGKHPETQNDYTWIGNNPLQIGAQDLPVIDLNEVQQWVECELPPLLPERYQLHSGSFAANSFNQEFFSDPLDLPNDKTIVDLHSAIVFLSAADADNYDTWVSVGHALKVLEVYSFGDQANTLFHLFSSKSDRYVIHETQALWDSLHPNRTSYKSIFAMAQKRGWTNPKSKEGLRQEQRELNRMIGEGILATATNEILTLEEMLDRFVYNMKGQMLSDRRFPQQALRLADARIAYSASRSQVQIKNGDSLRYKEVDCLEQFIKHAKRPTTIDRTFIAGADVIVSNEEGAPCFNSFRPFARRKAKELADSASAQPFIDHISWLFGNRADHFLDWLAHIEQKPGVLPQTAWLHIANNTGLGRNWISSVLVRVWPGYVASNFDLVGSLSSSFNGPLSHKLLAQVDELNEAHQSQSKWSFSERLKSMLNCEYREINNKYGAQVREKNACRFLMFSNHISAIPLEETDRRIEVVICESKPQAEQYYKELYRLLHNEVFIASVTRFLMDRDISSFNPGATALVTEHKQSATAVSKSETDDAIEYLVEHWPHDVIPTTLIAQYLPFTPEPVLKHVKTRAGINPYISPDKTKCEPIRVDGEVGRLAVIRSFDKWSHASLVEVKTEAKKSIELVKGIEKTASFGGGLAVAIRAYLDDRAAQ